MLVPCLTVLESRIKETEMVKCRSQVDLQQEQTPSLFQGQDFSSLAQGTCGTVQLFQ